SKQEFPDFPKLPFNDGDSIPVLIRRVAGPDAHRHVSWRAGHGLGSWGPVFAAYPPNTPVECGIRRQVKRGRVVDGVGEAFLPGSKVDIRPTRDAEAWVNETVSVLITEMDRSKPNVVVSRRKLLEKDRDQKRESTLAGLKVGEAVEGTVTNIASFGAFIDIG